MKIIVRDIVINSSGISVDFTTEFGKARARWSGTDPQIGKEYVVEVEIPDILIWGKDIFATEGGLQITNENETISIVGLFESIDEDGYSVIRHGISIVPVVTQGVPCALGTYVKLFAKNVILYEVEY